MKEFNIAAGHDGAVWGKGRGVPGCRGKEAVEAEMGYGVIDGQLVVNGVEIGKEPVAEMPF